MLSILCRISPSALWMAFVAAATMFAVIPASAQSSTTYSEYSAKFLCGTSDGGSTEHGEYSTSINVHNPNVFTAESPISLLKQASLAKLEGATLTPPSSFVEDSLPNDYAESIDCAVIRKLLGKAAPSAPAFIEGFVVIIVPPSSGPNQLDVVGVYTSSASSDRSLDVVPVPVRILTPPAAAAIDRQID